MNYPITTSNIYKVLSDYHTAYSKIYLNLIIPRLTLVTKVP